MKQAIANLVESGFAISYTVKVSKSDFMENYTFVKREDAYVVFPCVKKFTNLEEGIDFFLTLARHPNNLRNFADWQRKNGFDPEETHNSPEYNNLLKRYYAEYGSEFQNPDAIRFLEVAKAESEASENEDE